MFTDYVEESMKLDESPQRAIDKVTLDVSVNDVQSALVDIAVALNELDKRLGKLESRGM